MAGQLLSIPHYLIHSSMPQMIPQISILSSMILNIQPLYMHGLILPLFMLSECAGEILHVK
jgi:hypothetical protein